MEKIVKDVFKNCGRENNLFNLATVKEVKFSKKLNFYHQKRIPPDICPQSGSSPERNRSCICGCRRPPATCGNPAVRISRKAWPAAGLCPYCGSRFRGRCTADRSGAAWGGSFVALWDSRIPA